MSCADSVYLVSNCHVFSGRNPTSGQPKHSAGAVPDTLKISFTNRTNLNEVYFLKIPTLDADGKPLWLQSAQYGQKADVSVYNVTEFLKLAGVSNFCVAYIPCINEYLQVENMFIGVGSDVFVLGFPLGLMKTGILPIWKRASIATEYECDVNDMPSFLIDTATRKGMSGGPVLQHIMGGYPMKGGGIGVGSHAVTKVLGIYSGRYVGELDEAHLGIVWRMDLIQNIINNPAPGYYNLI